MEQWYACRAATPYRGRCESKADQRGFCIGHGEDSPLAPPPGVILLRINVSSQRAQNLELAGVPRKVTSRVEREERNIAQAKEQGLDPYRHGEFAANGTPVFGKKKGLPMATVSCAFEELAASGWKVQDVHLTPRMDGKRDTLVVRFQKGAELTLNPIVRNMFLELLNASWGFVHVWTNPPGRDGSVLHTVNCVNQQPGFKTPCVLEFQAGLWGVRD